MPLIKIILKIITIASFYNKGIQQDKHIHMISQNIAYIDHKYGNISCRHFELWADDDYILPQNGTDIILACSEFIHYENNNIPDSDKQRGIFDFTINRPFFQFCTWANIYNNVVTMTYNQVFLVFDGSTDIKNIISILHLFVIDYMQTRLYELTVEFNRTYNHPFYVNYISSLINHRHEDDIDIKNTFCYDVNTQNFVNCEYDYYNSVLCKFRN